MTELLSHNPVSVSFRLGDISKTAWRSGPRFVYSLALGWSQNPNGGPFNQCTEYLDASLDDTPLDLVMEFLGSNTLESVTTVQLFYENVNSYPDEEDMLKFFKLLPPNTKKLVLHSPRLTYDFDFGKIDVEYRFTDVEGHHTW